MGGTREGDWEDVTLRLFCLMIFLYFYGCVRFRWVSLIIHACVCEEHGPKIDPDGEASWDPTTLVGGTSLVTTPAR